jgi:hypothetical protein
VLEAAKEIPKATHTGITTSGFFKTPLSGAEATLFWKRTDLVGLGNILGKQTSIQMWKSDSATYSKPSSSVIGETMEDADRFLLLYKFTFKRLQCHPEKKWQNSHRRSLGGHRRFWDLRAAAEVYEMTTRTTSK